MEIKLRNLTLNDDNWKCATCKRFDSLIKSCVNEGGEILTPNPALEPNDECFYYTSKNENIVGDNIIIPETIEDYKQIESSFTEKANELQNQLDEALSNSDYGDYSVDIFDNLLIVKRNANNCDFKAEVEIKPEWNQTIINLAIEKAKLEIDKKVEEYRNSIKNAQHQTEKLTDKDIESLKEASKLINKLFAENNIKVSDTEQTNDDYSKKEVVIIDKKDGLPLVTYKDKQNNSAQEEMLEGETKLSWMNCVTSWNRVLNAARRTIGKKPLDKNPSDSWKAKILLAEHSPIRLLEYDWGWEKIRQWVSVHLVRHHEGVEKFVHSQRGDRRELPCDRDHIYQGARNDMDMTANAQGLINMSRKRCCNCASAETREAWKMVLDELETKDPILKSKCVRECVYRGFCPEWMSKCGYWKTDAYKRERANYKNTRYGKDVEYKTLIINGMPLFISNTGHIYDETNKEYEYIVKFENGHNIVYANNKPVCEYVINAFTENNEIKESNILHLDGNEWNNTIDNLKVIV